VHPEELAPDAPARRMFSLPDTLTAQEGDVHVPPSLAFGIREREERMLFEHLPLLSADMNTRHEMTVITNALSGGGGGGGGGGGVNGHSRKSVEAMSAYHETQLAAGTVQANVLAKVVDLRNANAAGIAFENRRRVIEAFSEPGRPNDSGRTEVQAALLTLQVRNVWNHLGEYKRDVANRRSLRRLVHQRAKILKYLKRTDRDRYERVLERLGLEPGAVEGELVV